jgi:DNA-binding NtrC family response regulator
VVAPAEAQALPLLIVEDNDDVVAALELLFALHEIPALVARSPDAALACLAREPCGAVLQDMNFGRDLTSGREGATLFRAIRARYPGLPVILMTAWTSLEMAVALVKEGADDYLAKPWSDAALVARVRSALERGRAGAGGLEFASGAMRRLVDLTLRVAAAGAPVLITGPNGSGKGRLAELLHEHSGRRGPLVRVDTGALPETLLEAELFGAEAGAYTGATRRREGLFAAARGGTLFLDEIANLPLSGQVKFLRVLESGEYYRLGSSKVEYAEVRVVAATNADLGALVERGVFRQDLFFRLAVIELRVPPLRERPEDVVLLAEHFLRLHGGEGRSLTPGAHAALLAHAWPGNVRELSNRVRRALLLSSSPALGAADLELAEATSSAPEGAFATEPSGDGGLEFDEAPPGSDDAPEGDAPEAEAGEGSSARDELIAALERHGGVIAKAAASLGLSRQAFYRRLESHGLRFERRLRR